MTVAARELSGPLEDDNAIKTGGVIAVDRALSILDAFLAASQPLSLSEIARATRLVKPTVLRSLVSLERAGFVLRIEDRRYKLGAKAMQLGAAYARTFRLESVVLPVLRQLTAETGESASFLVRECERRICLFRVESPQRVREVIDTNVATPLDETSGSRALRREAMPTSGLEVRPVYFTSGINDPQSASISTPIFDDRHLVGALSLSAPIHRFGRDQANGSARLLAAAATALTSRLGGQSFQEGQYELLL